MKTSLKKVHPAFLIAAIIAVIWIEWIMIPVQTYQNHPDMWIGLSIYVVISVLSLVFLKYLFSLRYKTVLTVMAADSLILIIPIGIVISLATGYTLMQLFSIEWVFVHDFVYVMIVAQLAVTAILLFGIWWKARKRLAEEEPEEFDEIEEGSSEEAVERPSLTSSLDSRPHRGFSYNVGLINGLGKVNGLTNGKGMSNGFTNGRGISNGLTNGVGTVNGSRIGSGLINGNGRTNGLANVAGPAGTIGRKSRPRISKRMKLFAPPIVASALILGLLLMPQFLFYGFDGQGEEVRADWGAKASYMDIADVQNPNIDIVDYRAFSDSGHLWTYMRTKGKMFGVSAPNSVTAFIFIDSDRDIMTGFSLEGMGADRMIKVYGYDGEIRRGDLFEFHDGKDNTDWNGWVRTGSADTALDNDVLQTKISLRVLEKGTLPIIQFAMIDSDGSQDHSETPIDLSGEGALVVSQIETAPDILERGVVDIMNLELIARGRPIVLQSLDISSSLGTVIDIPTPISIDVDKTVILTVKLDTTSITSEIPVEVRLDHDGISTNSGAIALYGNEVRRYVGSSPSGIMIDGAFGDWEDVLQSPIADGIDETANSNVDIMGYQTSNSAESAFFYMRVDGTMMGGVKIPKISKTVAPVNPTPAQSGGGSSDDVNVLTGSQSSSPIAELTGEDSAHVFIDSDQNISTGYRPTHPFIFPVGADYMIEIEGKGGKFGKSAYFEHSGNQKEWEWKEMGSVTSACDSSRLETEISLESLNLTAAVFDAYLHIADWSGDYDYSDAVLSQGLRGLEIVKASSEPDPNRNGGFADGDIDTIDGGSCFQDFGCHDTEDDTQVPISMAFSPAPPFDPGQTGIIFSVTVNLDNADPNSEAGVYQRVGPSGGGNARTGIENDGWVIESDPHSGTNNFIQESGLQGAGDTVLNWTVTAPSAGGTYYLEPCIHYDNDGPGQERNCVSEITVTVIPEFSTDVLPIVAVLTIVLAVIGKARQKKVKE
jgi:hypothetical protein